MFPKPTVIVSKCLGFEPCRYNGQMIPDRFIKRLGAYVTYKPVCPEMEIGLGVPRSPIRIVRVDGRKTLHQPAEDRDITDQMDTFVTGFLESCGEVEGFILKNRSPSCGISDVKIYTGPEKGAGSQRGNGFFGGAVVTGFPGAAIEDEGRLRHFGIREHFLIRLFTLARFREARNAGDMNSLIGFHTRHKLLLLALNQTRFRKCGRIVANHEKLPIGTVYELYEKELTQVLKRVPQSNGIINTLFHGFGGISDALSKNEKTFFLNTIEEYRDERIPLSAVLHLLQGHAVRFENSYLLDQVLLSPYPRELVEVTDSGKGRNY